MWLTATLRDQQLAVPPEPLISLNSIAWALDIATAGFVGARKYTEIAAAKVKPRTTCKVQPYLAITSLNASGILLQQIESGYPVLPPSPVYFTDLSFSVRNILL